MATLQEKIQLWESQWPNHCRTCDGYGEVYYPDDGSDSCPDCMESGMCPRCGEHTFAHEEESPCSSCGWDYGDGIPVGDDEEGV